MPECIIVLLGPWSRSRCFLKDERDTIDALDKAACSLPAMHTLTLPNEEMCVISFGL